MANLKENIKSSYKCAESVSRSSQKKNAATRQYLKVADAYLIEFEKFSAVSWKSVIEEAVHNSLAAQQRNSDFGESIKYINEFLETKTPKETDSFKNSISTMLQNSPSQLFLKGVGSSLDLNPSIESLLKIRNKHGLKTDWEKIGEDLKKVIGKNVSRLQAQ